ncbi:MAG TPA: 16S rRNA (cytosine(1402)-N(4))-methyltransferase RsmH [Candidatus Babeliales bacterium]|nr:16S rRNA (cytosine(1402)-N(4))-methyltransferase RsmH [Candidatus Babeliales bacterium]
METPEQSVGHKSVLIQEVLEYLNIKPGGVYLDVTFGVGGHTRAILEKEPTCRVIAIDWDQNILEEYGEPMVQEFGSRLVLVWGNFAHLYKLLKKMDVEKFDGILADFGTSQVQITERPGFSVHRDTPLDMRMSVAHQKTTAEIVINSATEETLCEIFWQYGDEGRARQIVRAIIEARSKKRIRTTKQLADIVARAAPEKLHRRVHPATKVFQALRIYVNKELDNITAFLAIAVSHLNPDGRLVCISFHSLEDRLVKQFFKDQTILGAVTDLAPKGVVGTDQEIATNPSARSARLRVVQHV